MEGRVCLCFAETKTGERFVLEIVPKVGSNGVF